MPRNGSLSKLYGALAGDSKSGTTPKNKAPEIGGKAIFAKDMEAAKSLGYGDPRVLFGSKDIGNKDSYVPCVNFGRKSDVGMMSDETRLRLFGLKKLINNAEIQAHVMTEGKAQITADIIKATPIYKQHLHAMLKAFNITDFSNWVPTVQARFFFEEFEIPMLIADLFDTMPMESATIEVPGALGRLFGRMEGDTSTFGVQSNTQAKYPVTAKNNVVHTDITEDLLQDSAPAIIDKLRREVVAGIARSEERAILDGDDSVTHMDTDVTAATDFRKAFKGIRKRGLANSGNDVVYDHKGDSPSKLLFQNMLIKAGKFASEKSDLSWIMGPTVGNQLVTGAIPELFTAFAFGGPASNVTGQVPPVFGIRPVESEWVREDLGAAGVYAAAETKTWMALIKRSRFENFLRQAIRVWAAPSLPSSDFMLMSAKKRHSWAGNPQSADEKSIIIGINIETSTGV